MFLLLTLCTVQAFFFQLRDKVEQCFGQTVVKSDELWGAYIVSGEGEKNVQVIIYDPRNVIEYISEPNSREGKFKVIRPQGGTHKICFKPLDNAPKSVSLELKIEKGKDLLSEEQIEPLEVALRLASRNVESVYRNLHFFQRREKVHRDISENNCDKIRLAAIFKIFCLVVITGLQIWGLTHILNKNSVHHI